MIDVKIISDKLETALQQKQNGNYKTAIKNELRKENWQNRKFELEKRLGGIKTANDFDNYQKELIIMFNELYEVITAPGVDDFIGWINNITENKNESNTKILRGFLVKHFSETEISKAIESININKNCLNFDSNEQLLFYDLLIEIKKLIKKICNDFLKNHTEFENNIESFIKSLNQILVDFNLIDELKFKEQKEFYSAEQISNKVEWYNEIVKQLIETNQSLKPINESEENIGLDPIKKTKKRIDDIKACIEILNKTGITNIPDESLKKIFLKFTGEMIKFDGGVKTNLEDFLENKWADIVSNYNSIKNFFNPTKNIHYEKEWASYTKSEEVKKLISDYNNIITVNPLLNIEAIKNTSDIRKTLNDKVRTINELDRTGEIIKLNIINFFEEIIEEYKDKNLPFLENLCVNNPSLISLIKEIQIRREELNNGKEQLKNDTDLLSYLFDSFTYDLNSYTDLSDLFKKALQVSGKREHLEWLDTKLNGTDKGNLNEADFEKSSLIKELLTDGLIKINIEKHF